MPSVRHPIVRHPIVRLPIVRILCGLLLLGHAPARAAEDLVVAASRKDALIEVRARATLEAPLSLVWDTLTDYERLPEFIPGLKRSRVLSRDGPRAIVEQSGEARFLIFSFPIEVTLESLELPPTSIRVRALAGNLRHLEGAYEVTPDSHGPKVVLQWTGLIAPDISLPPLLGEMLIRASIADQFTGMVHEIERREVVRRAREKDGRKK